MPQPPYLVDQIKIEPSSTGTRLVNAHADGDLQFSDPNVTAVLQSLVGIRNISGLYLVGSAGDGAPYTVIQDALDAIPDTSSPTAPSVVAITGGVYSENLLIDKDGVFLVGLGGVTIVNAVADATVKIADASATTPEKVVLQNLRIENTDDAEECVLIEGAGTYATGDFTVTTAPLVAGDTATINGVALVGVNGARTSGNNDFSVDGGTVDAIAAEMAIAINDPGNAFTALVTATSTLGVLNLTAASPGAGGNAITLLASTTPPGGLVASGATLTGGSAAGSPVALDEVFIKDCDLVASGVGGIQIKANTVNNVRVVGGSWRGSSTTSESVAINCASFRLFGVEWANDFQLAYDTGNDQPAITTSEYLFQGLGRVENIISNQLGAGSFRIESCPDVGNLTQGGDRTFLATHSNLQNMTISGTTAFTLIHSTRDTVTVAGGTPTLAESMKTGAVLFAAVSTVLVPFDAPQPDVSYGIYLDCPVLGQVPQVTIKGVNDFTISLAAPITGTVYYTVMRQI